MDKDIFDTSYLLGAKFGLADLYGSYYAVDRGSATKRRPRAVPRTISRDRVRRKVALDGPVPTTFGQPPESEVRGDSVMDRVVAGNSSVKQRATTKRKLKSGRLGRKLQKLDSEILYRWQRIYNYGQNTIAYPPDVTQVDNGLSGGRLQLSHFSEGEAPLQVNTLPVYLFDLTCWRTEAAAPQVCKRLRFSNGNAPQWYDVATQYQTHAVIVPPAAVSAWQLERSNIEGGGDSFPPDHEKKALLKWSDMRMCFYGARQHPTRIIIELIQFKDEKYSMNFHPDGEAFGNLSSDDQNDVRGFWLEECKKLVYHPLDVQQFSRQKAITSLYRESFQIAPDDTTNADVCPPNVVKRIFKRFNRLVNWDWRTPPVTGNTGVEANKNELETPAFQVGNDTNLAAFADPKARIYLYIRAEDMDPVPSDQTLSTPATVVPPLSNDNQAFFQYSGLADVNTNMNLAATPGGTSVCGYDWKLVNDNGDTGAFLAPRFCKNSDTPAQWSTTTTPSFDIMIRQKWVLQH